MRELMENDTSPDLARGLLFAFGSIIFYGSFAVPIKSKRVIDAKVDPLLFQLYKSIASFLFSLLLLFFNPWYWTWWAFLGSAIWVVTGTVAIFAVQYAGLICQSIWSCIPVFISSLVGVLMFGEMPRAPLFAFIGLVGIAAGLIGLGRVLSRSHHHSNNSSVHRRDDDDGGVASTTSTTDTAAIMTGNNSSTYYNDKNREEELDCENDVNNNNNNEREDDDGRPLVSMTTTTTKGGYHLPSAVLHLLPTSIRKSMMSSSRLLVGLAAAVVVGLLNAVHMVPFRIAQKTDGITSEDYIIPFATSALIVTLIAIVVHYGVVLKERPVMHVEKVAAPALLCGLLWSLGNFSTVHAVANLGLTVGYSLVQVQLLVSTAWAVLFYREIPLVGETVVVFVGSTVCIIVGMVLLSVFG